MSVDLAAELSHPLLPRAQRARRRPLPVRLLYGLWAVLLTLLVGGAAVLQVLGPPKAAPVVEALESRPAPVSAQVQPVVAATAQPAAPAPALAASAAPPPATPTPSFSPALPPVAVVPPPPVPAHVPGTVADPEPGLQEPSSLIPGGRLPRIGADRRTPMQAYASPFTATDNRPRVAILMAGMGMNEADTLAAIDALPAGVSLAFSPYSYRPDTMLGAARARGHEYLLSIPMEPLGYPLNDPGNHALLTGASVATNSERLEWVMSRFAGYVGATGAMGEMRGERFAASNDQMAPVLDNLADRGLLYVDPRPNVVRLTGTRAQRGVGRGVDVVLDDPPGRMEIDQNLARLEQAAKDRGSAIGLAGRPSPLVINRITAWAANLPARGLTLAPVSVVVQMPQAPRSTPAMAVRTGLMR